MSSAPRRPLDPTGFWLMFGLALLFGANNLMIKLGNEGLQPVFFAGVRSVIGTGALALWMAWRKIPVRLDLWRAGLVMGLLFSAEFMLLFIALDNTSVVRASSLFYAMPIWLALAAHFLFPGERLTGPRALGFALGFSGVVLTLAGRAGGLGDGSIAGDLAAIFAGVSWAAIVVVSRKTTLGNTPAETQILWQTVVSAVLLCALAPLYGGPLVRDFDSFQAIMLVVQALGVVCVGFVTWFWLLGRYQASTLASFSFLTPALSALLGWLVLDEPVAATTPIAIALLITGLMLINRHRA
ncbi:DMT family transporter [Pararhodobacter zhoushanensis]|uniref:DMT family transporter n=1 Tax=Pararhodobacter zhoushanensis TaxID=2479545 RepID=A0ABT3H1Z0_9RHOB|nr:DMT family transporter [Pararhodobacter zhoushanensis]MCW1933802.1 DMT family transporter [Pararhodobacter zhoushanensis]